MPDDFMGILKSEEEIRELIGYPSELVKNKVITQLDSHCRQFISLSPLLFISTSDEHGFCDVSPRGDSPGFVSVVSENKLIIPERPGNRRIDTMLNLLKSPQIGLIFLIPGLEETLRINGKAFVINDQEVLNTMSVKGKSPLLGIGVRVEECFIHCAKAFKRSKLWNPESWPNREALPEPAIMIASHVNLPSINEGEVKKILRESYTERLY